MDKEEKRQREKEKAGNDALYWNRLANEREFEVSNKLLAIASTLIPLFASLEIFNVTLTSDQKSLIILILLFLIASVVTGLIQYHVDRQFFESYQMRNNKIESYYEEFEYDAAQKLINNLKEKDPLKREGNTLAATLQTILFSLALILITILVASLLL
ncbi:hypothetical protein A2803_01110 [Candidatus Woesebacteria bacterium RIFCSPHIGHO2_01_FULL_44_21]|uniref:SMODS and SLOG-associating 2TM effector domain-containing protein n=1 Tax=Candidatus Woesebacteria bacterium RIFCSPHIGHO2_01_FULL_44_21 TaxID=1802503 RepID=A0A1F7YX70_9BACT|nr:MAG: hypothetical protein A2803_01110 [Candidatus Woesebacteria bacterium RIFCSPHIGHO2_01_FULL_44_21]OGM69733.1 MAG: hypothetical protein A2897_00300 [Candidatus Woesebacteria bacterium RIFCSPLOWO2_01_FULL_44_24b]